MSIISLLSPTPQPSPPPPPPPPPPPASEEPAPDPVPEEEPGGSEPVPETEGASGDSETNESAPSQPASQPDAAYVPPAFLAAVGESDATPESSNAAPVSSASETDAATELFYARARAISPLDFAAAPQTSLSLLLTAGGTPASLLLLLAGGDDSAPDLLDYAYSIEAADAQLAEIKQLAEQSVSLKNTAST